jgi:hypothetical protein
MATDLHNTPNQVYPVQVFIKEQFKALMQSNEVQTSLKKNAANQGAVMAILYQIMSEARLVGFQKYFSQYNERVIALRAEIAQEQRDQSSEKTLERLQALQVEISEENQAATEEAIEDIEATQEELNEVFTNSIPLLLHLDKKGDQYKINYMNRLLGLTGARAMIKLTLGIEEEAPDAYVSNKLPELYDQLFLKVNLQVHNVPNQTPKPESITIEENWNHTVVKTCVYTELLNLQREAQASSKYDEYINPFSIDRLVPQSTGVSNNPEANEENKKIAEDLLNKVKANQQAEEQALVNTEIVNPFPPAGNQAPEAKTTLGDTMRAIGLEVETMQGPKGPGIELPTLSSPEKKSRVTPTP